MDQSWEIKPIPKGSRRPKPEAVLTLQVSFHLNLSTCKSLICQDSNTMLFITYVKREGEIDVSIAVKTKEDNKIPP